jgi:sterol desaturase/sphingolipid hydroxylase (fatty acid hydroxylase superfamily)
LPVRGWNRHDVGHAITTLILGAVVGVVTTVLVRNQVIVLHGTWPTVETAAREVLVYLVAFEVYFYALHRLLHVPAVYRRIHIVHHRARSPSALGGLAFHPVEALLIIGFLPLAMWLLPIHLAALAAVSAFLSGSILLAHSDVAWFPGWWAQVPVLNWYVTPSVHARHHARGDCNFSATLSICDRVCGTLESHEASGAHGARDGLDKLRDRRVARCTGDAGERLTIPRQQDEHDGSAFGLQTLANKTSPIE